MKIKKLLALTLALTMTGAVLASCGDDDSSASSEATTTTTTTAASSEAEPAADSETAADDASSEEASSEDASSEEASSEDASSEEASSEDTPAAASDYVPVREFEGYDAFLMFCDGEYFWGNWNAQVIKPEEAYGVDADITGDGEYTVAITYDSLDYSDDITPANANGSANGAAVGTVVFCVDIVGLCDGSDNYEGVEQEKNALADGDDYKTNNKTKGLYKSSDLKVEVTSIKFDGEEAPFDASKIVYGNIETDNNAYRIEISNQWGVTAGEGAVEFDDIYAEESIEVTFKIEGLNKEG